MPETPDLLTFAIVGLGATVFMDIWALVQKAVWGIPALDYAMVGRWVGHMPRGQFRHQPIASAAPIAGEKPLGWLLHYLIGAVFGLALGLITGSEWLAHPTPLPALGLGIATVAFPYFILQPAFGAGVMARLMPKPSIPRRRSLVAHAAFGVGLFLAGFCVSAFLPTG